MLRRLSTLTLCALLTAILAGCGAIFNGPNQTISASSSPDGATVTVNPGGFHYTTPASIELERSNSYMFRFSKEGYSTATVRIERKLQGGILVLDILFTGLIGIIVDAATGSWYKLAPGAATATLSRDAGPNAEGPDIIDVTLIQEGDTLRVESSVAGVGVEVATE